MGAVGAAGDVRLKAEFMEGEAMGGLVMRGAGAGAEGMERSRRSFMPLVAGAADFDGAAEDAKASKPLRPPAGLMVRSWDCCAGGDCGFEAKKLPPPPNMLDEEVVGGDFALKLSRPEKGEGLGAGAAEKERLLKASLMPPREDCCGDA